MVIVTTDQDNPYGQRGLWGHPVWTDPPYMHDVTFRLPLVIRRRGPVAAGRLVDRIVSHVDILPTVLDHVGLGDIEVTNSPGRTLEPLLAGGVVPEADCAFCENETARSVRTPTHLYAAHLTGTGEPELNDLIADPEQWCNIANHPAATPVVEALAAALDEFVARDSCRATWCAKNATGRTGT